jgi:hypothetical protein
MKIKRVEHIAIAVRSLGPSIDLLKNTFGLTLEYEEQMRIAFIDPSATGNVLIELAELPQGHGAHTEPPP